MKSSGKKKLDNAVSPALKQEFRNLGALIEDNRHQLSAVAEQVGGLMQDMTSVKGHIDVIQSDMTSVKGHLNILQPDMASVKGHLDIIQSDVEIIKNNLKRKVDIEDFEALTRRVSVIERRVLK